MSETLPVVLTSRDYAAIETLMLTQREQFAGWNELIRRKLQAARVVHPVDVPKDVVTLRSRVRYRDGGALPDERTLVLESREAGAWPVLLLCSPRGLAMIGATAGQTVIAVRPDGTSERIFIERVLFQPSLGRPDLRVVSRQQPQQSYAVKVDGHRYAYNVGDDDDPGPSAA